MALIFQRETLLHEIVIVIATIYRNKRPRLHSTKKRRKKEKKEKQMIFPLPFLHPKI